MSARKLSRLAGFALVLAAVFGGVGVASAAQGAGAAPASVAAVDTSMNTLGDIVWT
jgi:hypothetical protein